MAIHFFSSFLGELLPLLLEAELLVVPVVVMLAAYCALVGDGYAGDTRLATFFGGIGRGVFTTGSENRTEGDAPAAALLLVLLAVVAAVEEEEVCSPEVLPYCFELLGVPMRLIWMFFTGLVLPLPLPLVAAV